MALYDPAPTVRSVPRIVDLFCGSGGFSRGAHAAGFDVVAAYDRDPILTSSFKHNFPDTPLYLHNVAWLAGERIRRHAGQVDGIIGGPPCQGFSEIGKRRPSDPRRSLLRHFFRIVAEVRPDFFIMENVRGLGFADARPSLDAAIDLVRPDYHVLGPVVWDAASFGAATARPRLFVIGTAKRLERPLTREHVEALFRPAATVRDAIEDLELARSTGDSEGFDSWRITRPWRPSRYAAALRRSGAFTGHRVTEHSEEVTKRFSALAQGTLDPVGRHKRLHWDGQCPTLRAGTGVEKGSFQSVRPVHPDHPRVITVREAARLQGFPDDHLFHPTVWHSFRMIGNSVSPIIGAAVLSAIQSRLYADPPIDKAVALSTTETR